MSNFLPPFFARLRQSRVQPSHGHSRNQAEWRVNNLTRLCLTYTVTAILLSPFAVSAEAETQWHELDDIRMTAARFIEERSHRPGQSVVVTPATLDARLRLHPCDRPLEPYLPPGANITANTTIGVRCTSPKQWKLFVPVRVGVSTHVWVATRPLARGAIISSDDFVIEQRDISTLHNGYIKANQSVAGNVLKRPISQGQALHPGLMTTPRLIRRGQSLTIVSGSNQGSVVIRMAGTALSDGRLGERIRVKNRSSGRTIEGVVRSSERVEVLH